MNNWKNTLWRAARTFCQAAIAYIAANLTGLINAGEGVTRTALGGLLVSAVAAGLAALMNLPSRASGIEEVEGASLVKKVVESVDELPLAGQDEPEGFEGEYAEANDE